MLPGPDIGMCSPSGVLVWMIDDERAEVEMGSKLLSAAASSKVDECIALNRDQIHHLPSLPPLNFTTSTHWEFSSASQTLPDCVHFPVIDLFRCLTLTMKTSARHIGWYITVTVFCRSEVYTVPLPHRANTPPTENSFYLDFNMTQFIIYLLIHGMLWVIIVNSCNSFWMIQLV